MRPSKDTKQLIHGGKYCRHMLDKMCRCGYQSACQWLFVQRLADYSLKIKNMEKKSVYGKKSMPLMDTTTIFLPVVEYSTT
jgi:hypothetical protein